MIAFSLGFLLFLSPLVSFAAEEPLAIELAIHDYPPLTGENLPYGGILTRIVRESFARQGVAVRFLWVPNNRAIAGAMNGMYDGSYGWAHAPDRDEKLLYSSEVLYLFRMVFFQRKGEAYPWKKLEDLKPYSIGITIGNHYSDEFSALQASGTLQVDEAVADVFNMLKLARGRIDIFPMEQEAGLMLADTALSAEEREQVTFQQQAIWEVPTYVVINKKHPRAQEILDRFDEGYRELAASGQLARIIDETKREIREQLRK